MAVSVADQEKAASLKVLKSIRDSEDSTNTARIQATKAIKDLLGNQVEHDTKPLESMSRTEIQAELRRVQALIG